jgi:hypothetical protein
MSWWTYPLIVLAAPMLLLALAGWALLWAFRRVCAAVAPRPEDPEWEAPVVRPVPGRSQSNRVFAPRARLPIPTDSDPERLSLN